MIFKFHQISQEFFLNYITFAISINEMRSILLKNQPKTTKHNTKWADAKKLRKKCTGKCIASDIALGARKVALCGNWPIYSKAELDL